MKCINIVFYCVFIFLVTETHGQSTSDAYWDALGVALEHYDNEDYVQASEAFEILWTMPKDDEMANHRLYAAAANCMIDNEKSVKENLMKIIPIANKGDAKRVLVNYEIFNKYKSLDWWKEIEIGLENRIASLISHHKNLHIFKRNRNYVYNGLRINIKGDTIVNKKIWLMPSGTGWGDEAADSQSEVVYIYETTTNDSINHYAEVDEMVGKSFWNAIDTTGIIENEEEVWIHPIRNNEFYKTETAPFPLIKFPVSDALMKTAKSSIRIIRNWGQYTRTETEVTHGYSGLESRTYANIGEIECHKLNGVANNSKYGKSYLEYYFHEDYGFTEMNYLTYDNETIVFKLINVEED